MSEIKVNKVSPATGTAITLGDSGDTFTVPSGATIVNSGTATGFGGGKLLQCLSATKTDTATNSSTSFVDVTGLSVAITPAATGSKILVSWHFSVNGNNAGSSMQIVRDSTAICIGDAAGSRIRSSLSTAVTSGDQVRGHSGNFLDSPSTTSATTYKIQWRSNGNTDVCNKSVNDNDTADYNRPTSTITVMEIGA